MTARRYDDELVKISDAITLVGRKVNLVGVVVDLSEPRRTRGTDWMRSLKIVDKTCSKPGLTVNVFTSTKEALPCVASLGDIVLFKHVKMDYYNNEVNAVFRKTFSSFALYDGEDGEDFHYYQCFSKFRDKAQYKKSIMDLREWFLELNLLEGKRELLFLREIEEGKRFDLLCKIVHVDEDRKIFFVWDGTDSPPLSIPSNSGLEDEANNNLKSLLEPSSLSRDKLCDLPTIGTILKITVPNMDRFSHILETGQWIKINSLVCKTNLGTWFGTLTGRSKIEQVPREDDSVRKIESLYLKRRSSNLERMPLWSFPWPSRLTEVDHDQAPFVSLMKILKYPEVTAKYRCIVRVVAVNPWGIENFRSHDNGYYRIRLTLEDPTARINAFLCNKDAEHFFGGHQSNEVLSEKLNKLLGVKESDGSGKSHQGSRDPPWVQCCLISYYTDKNNPWKTRRYKIFGTRLVG